MKQFNAKLCPVCRLYFVPRTGSAVYCGKACRKEAERQKQAEKEIKRLTPKRKKGKILSIAQIQRIGREHGLNYGETVAAIERGDIEV